MAFKRSTCEKKKKFKTLNEAKEFGEKYDQKAYKCGWCGMFHLTSMDAKDHNNLVKHVKKKRERLVIMETEYWEQKLARK